MMRIEYDKDADAAYLYIQHAIGENEVEKTVEAGENIAFDFDKDGKLLGIEILEASKRLKRELLLER